MSTLLVMAGGTGGHVFPALAVARVLHARGVEIVWLGTRQGLEARVVPDTGFDIEWVSIRGLRGTGLWGWLRTPFLLLWALLQTVAVVLRRRPAAMLGMGGFVAAPAGMVAWLLRRPLLIHEANALAGLTNKVLARMADRVMTGFPDTFPPSRRAVWVGNPVRPDITALAPPRDRLAHRITGGLRLLVIGGSQGARALNERVPEAIAALSDAERPQIWHQAGHGNGDSVRRAYESRSITCQVSDFIDDMASAYAWADLVIARAGAMTVAEVCAAGVAALFVPYPHAAGDHQTANAQFLASRNAAFSIAEQDVTVARLAEFIQQCGRDRERLSEIAERARALAKDDATERVAEICMEYLHA